MKKETKSSRRQRIYYREKDTRSNKIRSGTTNWKYHWNAVGTLYGTSLVVGIVKQVDGEEYIHLKERGTEDYMVKLDQWEDLVI